MDECVALEMWLGEVRKRTLWWWSFLWSFSLHLAVVSSSKFNILGCQHMATQNEECTKPCILGGVTIFSQTRDQRVNTSRFETRVLTFSVWVKGASGKDKDHEDPRSQRGFDFFDSTRSAGGNWDPVSLLPHDQGLEWQQSVTTWPRKSCYQGRHRLQDP